jgi:hypothetical protein
MQDQGRPRRRHPTLRPRYSFLRLLLLYHHRHSAHSASPSPCNSFLFILARCLEPTSHHRYSASTIATPLPPSLLRSHHRYSAPSIATPLPPSLLRSFHRYSAPTIATPLPPFTCGSFTCGPFTLPAFGRGIYRFVSSVYFRTRMDRPPPARCKSSPQYSCTLFSVLVSGLQVYYAYTICSQCRRCCSSRSIRYLALSDLLPSLSALGTWKPFTFCTSHRAPLPREPNRVQCQA